MEKPVSRLDALTGIRSLAAVWVIFYHFPSLQPSSPYSLVDYGILAPLLHKGDMGVDLFFVLSGFIIAYVHQHHFVTWDWRQIGRFLCLRFARLYPAHVAMLFVGLAYFGLLRLVTHGQLPQPDGMYTAEQFMMALINIHAWGLGITGGYWNGPSWSVSSEWFAYLTFPVMAVLFWCKANSKIWFLVLGGLALAALVIAGNLAVLDQTVIANHLVRVMLGFSWGVCIYNLYRENSQTNRRWDGLALGCIGTFLGLLYGFPSQTLMLLLFGPFIYCLSRSEGWLKRFFSKPLMMHLGEISYSIYLVHGIIVQGWAGILMRRLPASPLWHWALFVVIFAVVILCAEGLYRFVELPARNKLRVWIDRTFSEKPDLSCRLAEGQQ